MLFNYLVKSIIKMKNNINRSLMLRLFWDKTNFYSIISWKHIFFQYLIEKYFVLYASRIIHQYIIILHYNNVYVKFSAISRKRVILARSSVSNFFFSNNPIALVVLFWFSSPSQHTHKHSPALVVHRSANET